MKRALVFITLLSVLGACSVNAFTAQKKEPPKLIKSPTKEEIQKMVEEAIKKNEEVVNFLEEEREKFNISKVGIRLTELRDALDQAIKIAQNQKTDLEKLLKEIKKAKTEDERRRLLERFFTFNNLEQFLERHRQSVQEKSAMIEKNKEIYMEEMKKVIKKIQEDTLTRNKVWPLPPKEKPKSPFTDSPRPPVSREEILRERLQRARELLKKEMKKEKRDEDKIEAIKSFIYIVEEDLAKPKK